MVHFGRLFDAAAILIGVLVAVAGYAAERVVYLQPELFYSYDAEGEAVKVELVGALSTGVVATAITYAVGTPVGGVSPVGEKYYCRRVDGSVGLGTTSGSFSEVEVSGEMWRFYTVAVDTVGVGPPLGDEASMWSEVGFELPAEVWAVTDREWVRIIYDYPEFDADVSVLPEGFGAAEGVLTEDTERFELEGAAAALSGWGVVSQPDWEQEGVSWFEFGGELPGDYVGFYLPWGLGVDAYGYSGGGWVSNAAGLTTSEWDFSVMRDVCRASVLVLLIIWFFQRVYVTLCEY